MTRRTMLVPAYPKVRYRAGACLDNVLVGSHILFGVDVLAEEDQETPAQSQCCGTEGLRGSGLWILTRAMIRD